MKLNKLEKNLIDSRGVQDSVSFGIKKDGLAHIFNVLRNQLYSDPETATLREYACNAVDANVEAGNGDRPIEITLPSVISPTLKIRDHGNGLSDFDIHEVYANYGESTKTSSNDYIGQLGLGSKSGFSYSDSFTITSFVNGKKSVYCSFIDDSQVGQISKLSEDDTTEENGVEISIPVKQEDISSFEEKASTLFRHFKVKPLVNGEQAEEDIKYIFEGSNWKWSNDSEESVVVMGSIAYPIDVYSLSLNENDEGEDQIDSLIRSGNLTLQVEIGDLDIAASREKLQYTERTKRNLKAHLSKVAEELVNVIKAEFGGCKTLYSAKALWNETFDFSGHLYHLRDVLRDVLLFGGKKVGSSSFTFNKESVDLSSFEQSPRSAKWMRRDATRLECDGKNIIIYNDLGNRRGMMNRVLPLLIEGKKAFLVEVSDQKAYKEFVKDSGFDAPMINLSSLEKKTLSEMGLSDSRSEGSYTNKKHTSKVFSLEKDEVRRSYHRGFKRSDCWKTVEVDINEDTGIYVEIDRFKVVREGRYSSTQEVSDFKRRIEVLERVGIEVPQVVGVKTSSVKDFKDSKNWINFWTWGKEQLDAKAKNLDLNHKFALMQEEQDSSSEGGWSRIYKVADTDLINSLGNDHVLVDYLNEVKSVNEMRDDSGINNITNAYSHFDINRYDLKEDEITPYGFQSKIDEIEKTYPLLAHLNREFFGGYYGDMKYEEIKMLTDYIKLIDSKK